MPWTPFEVARLPRIVFGDGTLGKVPEIARRYGSKALVVTGARSFRESEHGRSLMCALGNQGMAYELFSVASEPSPKLVDNAVAEFRHAGFSVVLGIGGGSVLDAAKAIAGLLRVPHSVMDFLEGVGPELPYPGPSVPYIAVPTTAGTGSEATKNAVLSVRGGQGFKKSFRHDDLVPEYAVLDPQLLINCPRPQIAVNGMDAFTQLLESYVSLRANPFSDALSISGLELVRDHFFDWYDETSRAPEARGAMLYAALLSGITLAQAGLGSVHGIAAPLGAFFPVPHGAACGTMLAVCTEVNLRALRQRAPTSQALEKYAQVGRLLARDAALADEAACERLLEILVNWTTQLDLPLLSAFGLGEEDTPLVVANCRGSSMKTNPVALTDTEVHAALLARI